MNNKLTTVQATQTLKTTENIPMDTKRQCCFFVVVFCLFVFLLLFFCCCFFLLFFLFCFLFVCCCFFVVFFISKKKPECQQNKLNKEGTQRQNIFDI